MGAGLGIGKTVRVRVRDTFRKRAAKDGSGMCESKNFLTRVHFPENAVVVCSGSQQPFGVECNVTSTHSTCVSMKRANPIQRRKGNSTYFCFKSHHRTRKSTPSFTSYTRWRWRWGGTSRRFPFATGLELRLSRKKR
jgi:hypothetical protein